MQRKRLSTVIYRRLPGSSPTSRQLPSRLIYRYLQRCHIRTRVPLDPWDRSLMVHSWGTVPHARCRSSGLWSRRRCPHPKSPFVRRPAADDATTRVRWLYHGRTVYTHLGRLTWPKEVHITCFQARGPSAMPICSQFPHLAVADLRFTPIPIELLEFVGRVVRPSARS